ncbi:MAG: carbohydrate ABC transporter permease [Treponema sp.]|jgi:raffinose/stachyose/melibiose transport system permease protein|nr:carbohydrate ABC transporter permease [Treponema sp.]
MKPYRKRKEISILQTAVLLVLVLSALYPFFLLLITSLKTKGNYLDDPVSLPRVLTLANYINVYKTAKISQAMMNSAILTIFSVFGQLAFGSIAAYALAKMRFKNRTLLSLAFLFPLFLPIQSVIIPLYIFYKYLKLLNTLGGLIIIYIASGLPLAILMFSNFMLSVPIEISEAAYIDGVSHFGVYSRIILPLLKPAVATVIIISSLTIWNDFYLPMIMLTDVNLATLPLKAYMFAGQYRTDWTKICTCIVYLIIPVTIVYFCLQRQIIDGITKGAVKG